MWEYELVENFFLASLTCEPTLSQSQRSAVVEPEKLMAELIGFIWAIWALATTACISVTFPVTINLTVA